MRLGAIVALLALVLGGSPAHSATFTQNIFTGGDPGTSNSTQIAPFCDHGVCAIDYLSPLYHFNAGDIINFGTVTQMSFVDCVSGGSLTTCGDYNPEIAVSNNGSTPVAIPSLFSSCSFQFSNPSCAGTLPIQTFITPLIYTIPIGASEIQLSIGGGGLSPAFTYAPPVPEASTWAMMVVGFAGLGFAVITRRRATPRVEPLRA